VTNAGGHDRKINFMSGATAPFELDPVPDLPARPALEAEPDNASVAGSLCSASDTRGRTAALYKAAVRVPWQYPRATRALQPDIVTANLQGAADASHQQEFERPSGTTSLLQRCDAAQNRF